MAEYPLVNEKYERNGWPSLPRPDIKPPHGWDIPLMASQERVRNHSLSADGKTIAFIKDDGHSSDVFVIPSTGGWPQRISNDRPMVPFWDDEIPQWSPRDTSGSPRSSSEVPDSRYLAFTLSGVVHISDMQQNPKPEPISDFTTAAGSPRWMPDSNGLILSVTRHGAGQFVLSDRSGSWPRALTSSPSDSQKTYRGSPDEPRGDHWDAQPSPDGTQLLFTFRPFNDLNRLDICLIDLASGAQQTLYSRPHTRAWHARWSPDGQQIAFLSQESGRDQVWIIDHQNNGNNSVPRQLSNQPNDFVQFTWKPDNSTILAVLNEGGAYNLGLLNPMTGDYSTLRAARGLHSNPNWSPDGSFITFEFESPIHAPEIFRMEIATAQVTQLTRSYLPALSANQMVPPEQVSFTSFDGREIPAFLIRPEKPNGAAVLFPHGGPSAQYAFEWDIFAQYLVAKGYTYLAPNYRGSTGYGVEFEHANYNDWGIGDTRDCLEGARYLASIPGVDKTRIAIYGGSYGGYMVNCCLSRDPEHLFACGVAKYGDADTISSWALCRKELQLYTEIFLGHPSENRAVYEQSMPLRDVANVQKPILLLHGLLDDIVPPQASEEWAEALRAHGKTFEYKTYATEPHGFLHREAMIDSWTRIERFLDWYLLPRPGH